MVYYIVLAVLFEFIATKTSSSTIEPIILYGTPVRIEDYPYFAGTEFCGASIISERWLLTAAHCVDNRKSIANQLVFVGGERIDNSIHLRYDQIHLHPRYTPVSQWTPLSNDIAVLRLQTPLRFSQKVQPVRLPNAVSRNPRCTFLGRGLDESLQQSSFIKKMDVVLMSAQECLRATSSPNMYQRFFADQTIICGRKVDNKPGLCFGDSGSPLVQGGTIVGLASFLMGRDCRTISIGFYTNVVAFVPWIKSVTGLK